MKSITSIINIAIATSMVFGVFGCASKPSSLKPTDVSKSETAKYDKYNCKQVENKLYFLKKEVKQLSQEQNQLHYLDAEKSMWGVFIVTIPLLPLILDGDGETANNYKRVKGEYNYIQELVVKKGCALNIDLKNIEVEVN